MPVSHVITMIHGTFATHARWTSDSSPLCQALRVHYSESLIIRRFPWSGANRNLDRIEASKQLAGMLHEDIRTYPDAAHFLIAHSHGGNLALYALNDSVLQSKLRGVICMNTPFMSATRRDVEQIFFGLLVLYSLSYITWGAAFLAMIAYAVRMVPDQVIEQSGVLIGMIIFALGSFFFALKLLKRVKAWFITKREETIVSLSIPRIRAPKVLCIWSAGDEVFSLFNTPEGLANIPYVLLNVYCIILLFVAATAFTFFVPRLLGFTPDEITNLPYLFWIALTFFPPALAANCLIGTMIVAVLANFLLRIVPMGLPWRMLFSSFFVRLSFTQVPLMAQQVEFRDLALGLSFLNHSESYRQPEALNLITNWLRDLSAPQG